MSSGKRRRIFSRMEIFKDEIYVTWNEGAENVINSLHDYFMQANRNIEVHLFLHRNKFNENDIIEWPDNFTFHFSSTGSDNALQTSLIAYVLEKFEGIADTLNKVDIPRKSKIFFIQKATNQFEELKSMLTRLPLITEAFSFKLLALNNEEGKNFLFAFSDKKSPGRKEKNRTQNGSHLSPRSISENGLTKFNNTSPRTIQYGRRASEMSEARQGQRKSVTGSYSTSSSPYHSSECVHCDRRRGSNPVIDSTGKRYYCLGCFLDGKYDVDLCKNCLRQKHFEMSDKSTSIDRHLLQRNKMLQYNEPETMKVNAATSTTIPVTSVSVSCQTDDNDFLDASRLNGSADKELQEKFYTLMGKIEADQNDILSSTQNNNDKNFIPLDDQLSGHFKDGTTVIRKSSGFRVTDVIRNPKTNKYHCPYCVTKTFAKQEIFEVHLRNVHKKCNCSCEHYFVSREDYLDHFYEVFPLFCFESRKCPERFRSLHYQAIHHAQAHYSQKPFHCVPCTYERLSSNISRKVCFKDVESLTAHGKDMLHDEEEMFLKIKATGQNEKLALTGRANAINFSG